MLLSSFFLSSSLPFPSTMIDKHQKVHPYQEDDHSNPSITICQTIRMPTSCVSLSRWHKRTLSFIIRLWHTSAYCSHWSRWHKRTLLFLFLLWNTPTTLGGISVLSRRLFLLLSCITLALLCTMYTPLPSGWKWVRPPVSKRPDHRDKSFWVLRNRKKTG